MSKDQVTVNNNDAGRLTVNFYYVIAIIISTGGIILAITNERNEIHNKIELQSQETQKQITRVTTTLVAIQTAMQRFSDKLEKGTDDRYTRKDAALDCAMLALSNAGLVCHNPLSPVPQFFNTGMGAWKTVTSKNR